ncbi:MAG TPA: hypothetical protein VFF27_07540, partial [Bacteroidia bacterium]|nr:hypothetical protein [Bacteroidia bacterium]
MKTYKKILFQFVIVLTTVLSIHAQVDIRSTPITSQTTIPAGNGVLCAPGFSCAPTSTNNFTLLIFSDPSNYNSQVPISYGNWFTPVDINNRSLNTSLPVGT